MSGEGSDIADRLNRDIESVIKKFWPNAITVREKGVQVALLTPKIKEGKKGAGRKPTSSFKVTLSGANRGQWYRFSRDVGGYGLALLHYGHTDRVPVSKDDYREAFRYAKEFLGITQERPETPEEKAEREARRAQDQAKRDAEAKQAAEKARRKRVYRANTAKSICDEMVSIRGTLAEDYLVERGLPPVAEWPWNPDGVLGFIADHEYEREAEWESGQKIKEGRRFPCLIARVQDAFGETVACWQIYLEPGRPAKCEQVDEPKVGCGPADGGAVRIGGDAAWIKAGEGLESSLCGWALIDFRKPVWSTLSTSGMKNFEPPIFVNRMTIVYDGDKGLLSRSGAVLEPPGIEAAHKLQERMRSIGMPCGIDEMCILGDAANLLQERRKHEKQNRAAS